MSRYIGNYVRVPSSEPQQASAPGIWSLSDQLAYQRANLWPPARDPYYNQTVLHLSGDVAGTKETNPVTQPRTFLSDASTNNFLLTPNGDVSARPFSPYASSYSNYFDGSGDNLSIANNAAFQFGSGNFTIECWIYPNSASGSQLFLAKGNGSSLSGSEWDFRTDSGVLGLYCYISPGETSVVINGGVPTLNQWNHVAAIRNGSTLSIFLNGNRVATSNSISTSSLNVTGTSVTIASNAGSSQNNYMGYISNVRLVKGTAVYTTNFTPPTTPLENIAGTSLLTCQANRFKDNSSNNFTVTPAGNVAVAQNSPFVEYNTTSGSGYFDGTGDYLTTPSDAAFAVGTGDFTLEAWAYWSGSRATFQLSGSSNDNFNIYFNTTSLSFYNGTTTSTISGLVINKFAWNHIALTRTSGTAQFYLNGVAAGSSFALSTNWNSAMQFSVGRNIPVGTDYADGYISNLRFIKGSAIIPPAGGPTTPLTAITNTQLLTLQTRAPANNQGILDTGPNSFVVTRTGNVAQGSFSPFSASGWSTYFDGNADYLSVPVNSTYALGSSNFTFEFWVNPNNASSPANVIAWGSDTLGWAALRLQLGPTYDILMSTNTSSWGISANITGYAAVNGQWRHLAIVRNGTSVLVFESGTLIYSGSISGSLLQGSYNHIGKLQVGASTDFALNGYISNLRIIKNQALYSGTTVGVNYFTPSTAPLTATAVGHTGSGTANSITGTVLLLTCQSNRFVDSSPTATSVTVNGNVSVQPFSPFAPTQAYVASQLGGSAYFDGSSDYLSFAVNQAPLALGNSDFTVEAWVYRLNTNTACILGGQSDLNTAAGSAYVFYVSSSAGSDLYSGSSGYGVTSPNPGINQWAHVAWVRTGGTYSSYLNGVRVGNTTNLGTAAVNTGATNYAPAVGGFTNGTSVLTGYISGLRLIKGSGGYNANDINIVIPTAPPVATQNTSLLLNFTGAGIVDATGRNNLETVGNSAVQTSVIKYGSGSMSFDGTGDYLFEPHSTLYEFGSGDFTIEFWARANSLSGAYTGVVGVWFAGNTVTANSWYVSLNGYNATNKFGFSYTQSNTSYELIFNATTSTGSWDHYAIVRSGGTLYGFKNGASQTLSSGSSTISGAINNGTSGLYVGTTGTDGGGTAFNGYISNLRITKYARYTSNFNTNLPPGPFPLA